MAVAPKSPSGKGSSPFAVPLEDLVAGARVAREDHVTEQETRVPSLPSEAERRRTAEMSVIKHGL